MSPDCCSVHHTCCSAPPWDRASSFPASLAVTASFSQIIVLVVVEYLAVVLVYVALQVGHASVANFDCILVNNLVEGMVGRKESIDDLEKLSPYISSNIS